MKQKAYKTIVKIGAKVEQQIIFASSEEKVFEKGKIMGCDILKVVGLTDVKTELQLQQKKHSTHYANKKHIPPQHSVIKTRSRKNLNR
jgi:orotate phosphoribosyltransferase